MISQQEKFSRVLSDLFDNIEIIVSDLSQTQSVKLSPALIQGAKAFILSKDKVHLIEEFIKNTNNYWEKIHRKDDKFFIENSNDIFGEIGDDMNALKIIYTSNLIDDETKDYLWECLFSLIKISVKYVFEKRGTTVEKISKDGKSIIKLSYKDKDKFANVDLAKNNKLWDLKLW